MFLNRNCEQYVQAGGQWFGSNSLKQKVLVMLKFSLNYNKSFNEDIRTIKEAQLKNTLPYIFGSLYNW